MNHSLNKLLSETKVWDGAAIIYLPKLLIYQVMTADELSFSSYIVRVSNMCADCTFPLIMDTTHTNIFSTLTFFSETIQKQSLRFYMLNIIE